MGLNQQKGNMYGFVTHTWNAIKGRCEFDCSYCYMKRFGNQKVARFDSGELLTDLGENNFIFVGSSCDMFAPGISEEWIAEVLLHMERYPKNEYLLQSKNPDRFLDFVYPDNITFCTTIETNRNTAEISLAPDPLLRAQAIRELKDSGFKTMVTIEPILDFDLKEFVTMLKHTKADQINIGAVTGGHKLPEPSKQKVQKLIKAIDPYLKDNIKRLM